MTLVKDSAILVITMKVLEKTEEGVWYESCDGSECYLDKQQMNELRELLDVDGGDSNIKTGLL